VRVPQSRKEKIEAELKLLEWHKMANAAAIKVREDTPVRTLLSRFDHAMFGEQGALLQTKTTVENSPKKTPQHALDDERWIKRVIKEEHVRPLNVRHPEPCIRRLMFADVLTAIVCPSGR
jgi:hypothetical protein